jgi:PDZ domain-containing protein
VARLPPSNKSYPSGIAAILAAVIAIFAVLNLEVPYFSLTPGPAEDVFRLIQIEGAPTTKINGRLLLTTVSLREATAAEMIRGWFDSDYEIVSRSAIVPPGETDQEAQRRTVEQMDESQLLASAAALKLLGYDVPVTRSGVRIVGVIPDAPAAALLKRGDVILSADGVSVTRHEDFKAQVTRHKVGDDVRLVIKRGDESVSVTTKTIGRPENPSDPIIGVSIEDVSRPDLPLAIQIDSLGIGGPSAGLTYALGVVDILDPRDLARGRNIAGTGEISIDGEVFPVGGIRQKINGARHAEADIFIVPASELRPACSGAGEMTVIAVERLDQAVAKLAAPDLRSEC